jgi:hypothetical protein
MTNYNYLKILVSVMGVCLLYYGFQYGHSTVCRPAIHRAKKWCSHPASQPAHKPLAHMEQSILCHLSVSNSDRFWQQRIRHRWQCTAADCDSAASEWILNLGFVFASKPGRRKEHRIGVGVGLAKLVAWQSWQDFSAHLCGVW